MPRNEETFQRVVSGTHAIGLATLTKTLLLVLRMTLTVRVLVLATSMTNRIYPQRDVVRTWYKHRTLWAGQVTVECSAVRYRRLICCSSMALPEIKYTKVKTHLFTDLAVFVAVWGCTDEIVQWRSKDFSKAGVWGRLQRHKQVFETFL